jgi:Ca2+-binding EF-hand superfamily protein
MVIPALYRLFSLMSDDSERLFFDEWVDGLMVFCLYNKEYLIRFVFDILDTDEDGYVLKKEILKYVEYTNPKTGEPVFHTNFL